jgi:tetratricopeptide (TPR) repeat protein
LVAALIVPVLSAHAANPFSTFSNKLFKKKSGYSSDMAGGGAVPRVAQRQGAYVSPGTSNMPKQEHSAPKRWVDNVTHSKVVTGIKDGFKQGGKKLSQPFKSSNNAPVDSISVFNDNKDLNANFYLQWGLLEERKGNLDKAEQQYEQALKVEPGNVDVLLAYAHMYDRHERLAEAETYYHKAVQQHPRNASAWNDLGLCLARDEKLAESAEALNKAVALDPKRKLYRNNLATVLIEMGQHDQALRHLQAVHPQAVAFYNVGFLLQEKGDSNTAANYFAQALHADPTFDEARQWLAQVTPRNNGQPQELFSPTQAVAAAPRDTPRYTTGAPAGTPYDSTNATTPRLSRNPAPVYRSRPSDAVQPNGSAAISAGQPVDPPMQGALRQPMGSPPAGSAYGAGVNGSAGTPGSMPMNAAGGYPNAAVIGPDRTVNHAGAARSDAPLPPVSAYATPPAGSDQAPAYGLGNEAARGAAGYPVPPTAMPPGTGELRVPTTESAPAEPFYRRRY